jgi:hypothetical protein
MIPFPLLDVVIMLGFLGWPGLVIGGAAGAIGWPSHRIWGALILGVAGLVLSAALRAVMW